MSSIALIKALAEDRKKITYRPSFAKITGSVLGAILLQQVLYWTDEQGGQFYKFMQPCKHPKYKKGDSWAEELEFTRYELTAALKAIATKSTSGANKKELMAVNEVLFDKDGMLINAPKLVIYWTDSSRITWFWLNTELLGNAVSQHYLGNVATQNYLGKAATQQYLEKLQSSITSITETTPKTTAEKKDIAQPETADGEDLTLSSLRSDPLPKPADHLEAFEEFVDTLDIVDDLDLEDPKPTLYECTPQDIASLIAVWYEWVPVRPSIRGKVGTLADHMKVPTNREYAKNLWERGVRPIDFVRVLFPYRQRMKAGEQIKPMTFQYVCPIVDEYVAEHWTDDVGAYTQDDPRYAPKKPGAKGVRADENMWERDDYYVDIPPRYIAVHELEDRDDETEDDVPEHLPEDDWSSDDWAANGEPL